MGSQLEIVNEAPAGAEWVSIGDEPQQRELLDQLGRIQRLERRLAREKATRHETERIAEHATRQFYDMVLELRRFKDVLEQSPDVVVFADLDGSVRYVNRSGRTLLLGSDTDDAAIASGGLNLADFHPDLGHHLLTEIAVPAAIESGSWTGELLLGRSNGASIPALVTVVRHANGADSVIGVIARDLTERKRHEAALERAAFVDPVTGLPNRNGFLRALDERLSQPVAGRSLVALVDLDGFSAVNTTIGPEAGDRLLVAVADRFRACIDRAGTVSRIGADEFAILTEISSIDETSNMVAVLRDTLARPLWAQDREVQLDMSVGTLFIDQVDHSTGLDVLRDADTVLSTAKQAGRGAHRTFDPHQRAAALARVEVEQDLRSGLAQGQVKAWFQPEVDATSLEIVGFEALARWEHPARGVVSPATFIGLAEETGLIDDIGAVMMSDAARQLARLDRRQNLFVGVNIAATQLSDNRLLRHFESLCNDGLDPTSITIEVTESAALSKGDASLICLRELAAFGARIAIDDFGTGYSSLAHLRDLDADVLKIDRAFVAGITTNRRDRQLVQSMVDVARAFDMTVVAEGVETDEQAAMLRDLGADLLQGWLFAPALAPADLEALLARTPLRLVT